MALTLILTELGLLGGGQDLIERRIGLGVVQGFLALQRTDGGGDPAQRADFIGFHRCPEIPARGFQTGADGKIQSNGVRENGDGLGLLTGVQSQQGGQKLDAALRHIGGVRSMGRLGEYK